MSQLSSGQEEREGKGEEEPKLMRNRTVLKCYKSGKTKLVTEQYQDDCFRWCAKKQQWKCKRCFKPLQHCGRCGDDINACGGESDDCTSCDAYFCNDC